MLFDLIGALFRRVSKRSPTRTPTTLPPPVVAAPAVIRPVHALDAQRMIDEAQSDWKAEFDRDPECVNIIYREGTNSDGTLNSDQIDKWNDQRCLVRFISNIPRLIFNCIATTTPGIYYDRQHVIGGPQGAALIAPGQQSCWQVGIHHPGNAHESLVQTGGAVRVYRDFDRSFRRTPGHITTGFYGINQHSTGGMDARLDTIKGWSAGCLVVPYMSKHKEFMALVKGDKRYQANKQHVFDTTVLPRPNNH